MKNRVYVDSDGVLVNFNKAFAPAFGLVYPTRTVLNHEWLMTNAGVSEPEFYRICARHPYLWERADPYPWTDALVQMLDSTVPEWMILTSATHDPDCWSGKLKWYKTHLGESSVRRVIMIGGRKERIASEGDLLIDDRYENVEAWRAAGGEAIHWIDYTEDLTKMGQQQIDELSEILSAMSGTAVQAEA